MLTLTTPDGHRIYIVKSWVQAVRSPTPGEYNRNTRAVLILSGVNQAVREDIETVTELMLKA